MSAMQVEIVIACSCGGHNDSSYNALLTLIFRCILGLRLFFLPLHSMWKTFDLYSFDVVYMRTFVTIYVCIESIQRKLMENHLAKWAQSLLHLLKSVDVLISHPFYWKPKLNWTISTLNGKNHCQFRQCSQIQSIESKTTQTFRHVSLISSVNGSIFYIRIFGHLPKTCNQIEFIAKA